MFIDTWAETKTFIMGLIVSSVVWIIVLLVVSGLM